MGISHAFQWAGFRFTSTILDDIQHQVLFFAAFATMVCCVSELTSTNLGINNVMITVVGTVVSLVVSFKTNSAYSRWWEGRNIWANVTTNSRHLAMLIWMQVPNIKPAPKEDKNATKKKNKKSRSKSRKSSRAASVSESDSEPTETLLKGFSVTDTPKREAIRFADTEPDHEKVPGAASMPSSLRNKAKKRDFTGSTTNSARSYLSGEAASQQGQDKVLTREEEIRMRKQVAGMVEKKTYIGLVQAFGVAMKHSLRGELGPYYTDLFSLISFLPKYNTSVIPPVGREHLFVGWDNGIPRQKADYDDGTIAVPLTTPAPYDGYAFECPDGNPPPIDEEKISDTGFTTTSYAFRDQALHSATAYIRAEGESRRHCFARLDRKHRVIRRSEDKAGDKVPIMTVELMPPRHPPKAQYWDFFPPLRVIKVITDWIRKRELVQQQERVRGGKRKRNGGVRSEIPHEIIMYLSAYVDDLVRREMLNASYIGPMMTCILEFQKALSDLEKIATTPIPSAYSFHLRLTVWAYLLFLPFQIYPLLRWITIPAVAVAAITYLGFLEIGAQIEMPFAYDQSDLDIDKFVLKIAHQLAEVTAFPCDIPSSQIILSHLNQPFLPTLPQSAPELIGVSETKPAPNPLGFSAAFEACKEKDVPTYDHTDPKKAKTEAKKSKKGPRSSSSSTSSSSSPSSSSSSSSRSSSEAEGQSDVEATDTAVPDKKLQPLPKTVRDLELGLTANWRAIQTETENFIGKPRNQLENRSGLEVAVLTL